MQGGIQRFLPLLVRELRQTEYQVYADVVHSGSLEYGIGPAGRSRIVPAVHEPEDAVIERLDSHAHPVHSKFLQSFHIIGTFVYDVFRIDLDSEFVVRSSVPCLSKSVKETSEDM